jgi:hypothetical protein
MKLLPLCIVLCLSLLATGCSYGRKGEILQEALACSAAAGTDYMTFAQAKMRWGEPVQVVEDTDGTYVYNVKLPQWVRQGHIREGQIPPYSPKGYLIAKFSDRYTNEITTTNTVRGPASGRAIQLSTPISSSHGCSWYVYFVNEGNMRSIMLDFGEEGREDCYD